MCRFVCKYIRVCLRLPDSLLLRSSLHAALRARYRIGDDDLLHQVAIGFEADGLPGLRGERVQLPSQEEISGLNLINTLHSRGGETESGIESSVALARFLGEGSLSPLPKDRYYS